MSKIHTRDSDSLLFADVSSYQLEIDWEKLKEVLDGVVMRVGFVDSWYGGDANKTDPRLKEYQKGARSTNLNIGYYYYAFADEDPLTEARRFKLGIGEIMPGESIWLDLEDRGTKFTKEWVTDFINEIEKLSNRICHIYTDYAWALSHQWLREVKDGKRKLWLAYYWELENINLNNTPGGEIIMHQYTTKGRLPGIRTNVDLNNFFGTDSDWKKLAEEQ